MSRQLPPTPAQALRRAAVQATLAPSVHNTQPWRFVLRPDALEVHADTSRWSQVLDPAGRQMLISCGCALFNARVSLAAAGFLTHLERLPDPLRPEVLARLRPDAELSALRSADQGLAIGFLDPVIEQRRSSKGSFVGEAVPDQVIADLVIAAAGEGAELRQITRPDDRRSLVSLSREADDWEAAGADPGELHTLTRPRPEAERDDHILAPALSAVGALGHRSGRSPEYGASGSGPIVGGRSDGPYGCLLVLGTAEDSPMEWLRAGEALEHVLLEVARRGLAVLPLTRVIEVAHLRSRLRSQLRLSMQPQVLLRVGRAPPMPAPRRRRLVDMVVETA